MSTLTIKVGCLLLALFVAFSAQAEDKIFALVPKYMNHAFFTSARDGCIKAAGELKGIQCLYIAPAEADEQGQLQTIQDLITRRVAGIAVSPANAPAMARILKMANSAKIPVITWDSDLNQEDRALRITYIGTNNYEMGLALGRELVRLKPGGGTIAIQSGEAAAASLNERVQGVRDALKDKAWKEVAGTPLYTNGDSVLSVKQMEDILTKFPTLDAFLPVGAWPQSVPNAYRLIAKKHLSRINDNSLVIISGDTMAMQIDILRDGLGQALVGQRPFEMGYRAIQTLNDIVNGKMPSDPIYTALDVCTKDNLASCLTQ